MPKLSQQQQQLFVYVIVCTICVYMYVCELGKAQLARDPYNMYVYAHCTVCVCVCMCVCVCVIQAMLHTYSFGFASRPDGLNANHLTQSPLHLLSMVYQYGLYITSHVQNTYTIYMYIVQSVFVQVCVCLCLQMTSSICVYMYGDLCSVPLLHSFNCIVQVYV